MDDVFAGESDPAPVELAASEAFVQQLTTQVNHGDIRAMVADQVHMLQRFEKTNEMLLNFNSLSRARFDTTQLEFRKHTTLIASMKKDLDAVFKRIRVVKGKLAKQYPDAFKACSDVYNLMEEDEEEEGDTSVTSGAQTPVTPKILMQPADPDDDVPTPVHTCTAEASTSSEDPGGPNYDRTSTSTIVEESEEMQTSPESPLTENPS